MNKEIYCVKCKKVTQNINPKLIKMKNGTNRISAKCNTCNKMKSQFTKN